MLVLMIAIQLVVPAALVLWIAFFPGLNRPGFTGEFLVQ